MSVIVVIDSHSKGRSGGRPEVIQRAFPKEQVYLSNHNDPSFEYWKFNKEISSINTASFTITDSVDGSGNEVELILISLTLLSNGYYELVVIPEYIRNFPSQLYATIYLDANSLTDK